MFNLPEADGGVGLTLGPSSGITRLASGPITTNCYTQALHTKLHALSFVCQAYMGIWVCVQALNSLGYFPNCAGAMIPMWSPPCSLSTLG